jgi:formamidopyrimidine-DNA glycosylase
MPELPEVETTKNGISRLLKGRKITAVKVHNRKLRLPVPENIKATLEGQTLLDVTRRAKYLLLKFETGFLIIHLGMSGSLRVAPASKPKQKHDHIEIYFGNMNCLRFRDPRRFGLVIWTETNPEAHKLLSRCGPEPLSEHFDGKYLHDRSKKRQVSVKSFIMNSQIVVGVGNIYASEALFRAGINPNRMAGKIGLSRYLGLGSHIKDVLTEAIASGGTTLKDFLHDDGKPGYFRHKLQVYARKGEPCNICSEPIKQKIIAQRSSFYCSKCQS